MSQIDAQFAELELLVPRASRSILPTGQQLVLIPDEPLPTGWTKTHTSVRFLIPVGYPMARLDCFWADPDLRIHTGQPQASQVQQLPDGSSGLWFSWHVSHWDPNSDTLSTYLHVVRARLREPR